MESTSEPPRGEVPTSDYGGTTAPSEDELLRRGQIAAACYRDNVVDIQNVLIDTGVSAVEGKQIANKFAIAVLYRPAEYRSKFRAFIRPGVTWRSFVDDVTNLLADEDEALVTNTAIVGYEGIYPRSEEAS